MFHRLIRTFSFHISFLFCPFPLPVLGIQLFRILAVTLPRAVGFPQIWPYLLAADGAEAGAAFAVGGGTVSAELVLFFAFRRTQRPAAWGQDVPADTAAGNVLKVQQGRFQLLLSFALLRGGKGSRSLLGYEVPVVEAVDQYSVPGIGAGGAAAFTVQVVDGVAEFATVHGASPPNMRRIAAASSASSCRLPSSHPGFSGLGNSSCHRP